LHVDFVIGPVVPRFSRLTGMGPAAPKRACGNVVGSENRGKQHGQPAAIAAAVSADGRRAKVISRPRVVLQAPSKREKHAAGEMDLTLFAAPLEAMLLNPLAKRRLIEVEEPPLREVPLALLRLQV